MDLAMGIAGGVVGGFLTYSNGFFLRIRRGVCFLPLWPLDARVAEDSGGNDQRPDRAREGILIVRRDES